MTDNEKIITVHVKKETYEKVKEIAFKERTTMKKVINDYLEEGIRKEDGQLRF